jgi:hypothetical protein
MANKWDKRFWKDAGERVGSAVVTGVTTMLVGDGSGTISGDAKQWWLIVGLPTALVALKCLSANLAANTQPSASVVNVTSNPG